MDNKALIEACKKGNRNAQWQLYNQFAKSMFNTCIRIVKNREEAEDILQESFFHAFSQIKSFRGEASFGTWLKRIVVNKSINALKKKNPNFEINNDFRATDIPFDFYEKEEQMLTVQKIQKTMDELPDGYRTILSLYLLEGYDHHEIAAILNISTSTSKSQYKRAKEKIKTLLMQKHMQKQKNYKQYINE